MNAAPGRRLPGMATVAGALAVALSVLAACWPALHAGFVSDDFLILTRLSEIGGIDRASAYFGLRHFDYYRPLTFLSYALDWSVWGGRAAGYHLTSLALHILNALLVFALARRMAGAWPSALAAALFGLHPSNHEAVFWIAARFDLLATTWCLLGLWAVDRARIGGDVLAAVAFMAAVLSKESALGFPIVAVAYAVVLQRAGPGRVLRQLLLFACAGAAYMGMRHVAGLAAAGGLARIPKVAALAAIAAALAYVARRGRSGAGPRWPASCGQTASWLAFLTLTLGVLAMSDLLGAPVRRALVSIGFAAAHLLSPVGLDSLVGALPPRFWVTGWVAIAGLAAVTIAAWRFFTNGPWPAFILLFLIAALVPVSSMTEGSRYLYLASVPVAMLAGLAVAGARAPWAPAVQVAAMLVLAASGWALFEKGADWRWASAMTEEAAAVVSGGLSDRCQGRDVVMATAPVRVRGVYSNINLEGMRWLRSCEPASLRTLVRVGREDPPVQAAWADANQLVLRVAGYRGGFVTSRDLRSFDVDIGLAGPTHVSNPLGMLDARPREGGLDVQVSLRPGRSGPEAAWFYFGSGRLRPLPRPVE